MATDIRLNNLHDLDITSGDLELFTRVEDLAVQMVKTNLLLYKGEWFRDIDLGIPYVQEIFGNKNTQNAADANIKNTILNTDNIRSITSYTGSIDPTTRKYKVVFSAITDSGDIINNIEVEI